MRRGTCTFDVKGANVAAAGAAALVVYSNLGNIDGAINVPGVPIPVVYISRADGELINGRLDAGPVQLTWGGPSASHPTTPASSRRSRGSGLAADLSLKPDLAAPGGLDPLDVPGGEGRHRGAERHVDGRAARRRRRRAVPAGASVRAGRRRRRGAAQQRRPGGRARRERPELVVLQGAGLADVDDAILATTTITPAKLSLRRQHRPRRARPDAHDRQRRPARRHLRAVERRHARRHPRGVPRTGRAEHIVGHVRAARTAASTRITVRPGEHVSVDVRIAPDPALPAGALYGGFLVFAPEDGAQPLRVPYAGYHGRLPGGARDDAHGAGLPVAGAQDRHRARRRVPRAPRLRAGGAPERPSRSPRARSR